jgi:uncharacterized protein YhhL (DUF1145 family)
MQDVVKVTGLLVYLLAAFGAWLPLPAGLLHGLQVLATVLVIAHVLELAVFFKHVKKYPGQLVDSIALTLLFGYLHWLPLSKQRPSA